MEIKEYPIKYGEGMVKVIKDHEGIDSRSILLYDSDGDGDLEVSFHVDNIGVELTLTDLFRNTVTVPLYKSELNKFINVLKKELND